MSSTYRPICLNHNPALTIDREIRREAVDTFNNRDGLDDHQHCDIIIGRWSGGLCELACLGRQLPGPTGCKGHHSGIEWTDRDWLRLLLAAAPSIDAELLRPLVSGCWPLERLERLRVELAVPDAAPIPQATAAQGPAVTCNATIIGRDPVNPDRIIRCTNPAEHEIADDRFHKSPEGIWWQDTDPDAKPHVTDPAVRCRAECHSALQRGRCDRAAGHELPHRDRSAPGVLCWTEDVAVYPTTTEADR